MKKFKFILLIFSAFSIFANAVSAQQTDQPNAKALEMMSKGDFRGSVGVLDKDIEKQKNVFQAFKLRGSVKRIIGDFNGAIADFSKALEIKSDNGELYEMRAMTRFNLQKDFDLILQDLDAAISYGRKYEKIYNLRGIIKSQNGDIDGAIADYQTAIGLRPEAASAYIGLATLYSMKNNDPKAAVVLEQFIKFLEESGKKTPKVKGEVTAGNSVDITVGNETFGTETIIVKDEKKNSGGSAPTQEMLDRMSDKIEQSKNTAMAYLNLAAIYERKKDYPLALETVEKGIKIDPTDFYGYEMRGKIKLGLGDYEGTIADINKAIGMFSVKTPKYLDRGIAYLMLSKETEAQKDFETYLQQFPAGKENLEKRIAEAQEKMQKTQLDQ